MDPATVAMIINAIANIITVAAPVIVDGSTKAAPFAEAIFNIFKGKNLTDDDINEILAKANALSAQIQHPDFIAPKLPDDV